MRRDVVYFLNADGPANEGRELRYSLRSLVNLPHGRVILLGHKPKWVTDVEYVPFPNDPRGKWFTLMAKFAWLAEADLSEVVYAMGDDFYIARPVGTVSPLFTNTLSQRAKSIFAKRSPRSVYGSIFANTERALRDLGADRFNNHQVHAPQVVERAYLPADLLRSSEVPLGAASLAGNLQALPPEQLARDHKPHTPAEFHEWKAAKPAFLSSSDRTFTSSGIEAYLARRFPEPSTYER